MRNEIGRFCVFARCCGGPRYKFPTVSAFLKPLKKKTLLIENYKVVKHKTKGDTDMKLTDKMTLETKELTERKTRIVRHTYTRIYIDRQIWETRD